VSEDAIQAVCDKDLAALARVFEVYTSVKHCEQALQHAQETVRTDQALQGSLRAVEMRVRRTCERTEPGVQPARTPDHGPATTMAVHLQHDTQGAQRVSDAPRLTVRFAAPADDDAHNEGTDESHAERNNQATESPPRSTEPRGDELGASRHSEAGAAVSEQPEKARKKPRLMTDEERKQHKQEQSRQRIQKWRNKLRAAPGGATPATVAGSCVGDGASGDGGDGAL
jgi:hypothetical protein